MKRKTKLELTRPLCVNGREVQINKAYTNQQFVKPTTLADDIFTYVSFFYMTHRKAMHYKNPLLKDEYGDAKQYDYEFYWKQAENFYQAYNSMPFETKPVAAYYCMLNAAKSYISYSSSSVDDFVEQFGTHGINESKSVEKSIIFDLDRIQVKHKDKGVFPLMGRMLDKNFNEVWQTSKSYSLKQLLYNLCFVHRAYVLTYSTRNKTEELFIPLYNKSVPTYYRGNDNKSYLVCFLDLKHCVKKGPVISSISTEFIESKDEYKNNEKPIDNKNVTIIRSKDGLPYYTDSISKEIRCYNNMFRRNFVYIHGNSRMWYIKRTDLTSENIINLNSTTINMAVMHRISEIARYKPEQLNRMLKSKEKWLIHEYISNSLDQFIDEISAEITKQEIMCSGMR